MKRDYSPGWAKWWRLPSYWWAFWSWFIYCVFEPGRNWRDIWYWYTHRCPCLDGSNDFYWAGYFKKPHDCACGG